MKVIVIWLCAVAAAAGLSAERARAEPAPPLVVYAASSLTELVEDIGREWQARTGVELRIQTASSSTLARQIAKGAPADLFLSAAPRWVHELSVLEAQSWIGNRLVAVVRRDDVQPLDLSQLESLAVADEHVPAGRYARDALDHLGIALPSRTLLGASARDVLSKVSRGGARAGIVYATDVAVDPALRVAFRFPPESHAPIRYTVALLSPQARSLFEALDEHWVQAIAEQRGFLESP